MTAVTTYSFSRAKCRKADTNEHKYLLKEIKKIYMTLQRGNDFIAEKYKLGPRFISPRAFATRDTHKSAGKL